MHMCTHTLAHMNTKHTHTADILRRTCTLCLAHARSKNAHARTHAHTNKRAHTHTHTNTLIHTPQKFFDSTPLGRILNRFSKDQDTAGFPKSERAGEEKWLEGGEE